MPALSDYLESGILNHIFRNAPFPKPSNISVALTSGVPLDSDNGTTIPEIPSGVERGNLFVNTNYRRLNLFNPATSGDATWNSIGVDNSTAYAVFSNEVNHSGYFYPLYLNSDFARLSDPDNQEIPPQEYTFSLTFPNVTFYAPFALQQSGIMEDPGLTLYEGNGFIKNKNQLVFNTALTDWGWVSGVAILDNNIHGSGNLLMYAELDNPRYVYTGDNIKFDINSLEISLR